MAVAANSSADIYVTLVSLLLFLCLQLPLEAGPCLDYALALSPTTDTACLVNTQIKDGVGIKQPPVTPVLI